MMLGVKPISPGCKKKLLTSHTATLQNDRAFLNVTLSV